MPQAVDSIISVLEQLSEQIRDLEGRVTALEGLSRPSAPSKSESVDRAQPLPALQRSRAPATWQGFPPAETPAGVITVLGKAVLAFAGAYLLRAIAESGSVAEIPVLIAAIVYAGFWMVWAARIHSVSRFASATWAVTSSLILCPLLWESTVRFQVLPPMFAAAVLVAFTVLSLGLAWRRNLQGLPWVAISATVITALALILATHELVPLTAALLAVALATEAAASQEHRFSVRAVPAIAADLAVCLLIFLMTSPEGVPEGYPPIGLVTLVLLCCAPLLIYGGVIAIRCFGSRRPITAFEITQGALALTLAAFGAVRASRGAAALPMGLFCLLLAAVFYWGAFSRFDKEEYVRNRIVSGTWSPLLLLAASFLVFSENLRVLFICLAAVAAVFSHARTGKFFLGLHASIYLVAASAFSSVPLYVASALAGTVPSVTQWDVWAVAISAAVCYPIGAKGAEDRAIRLLWTVPAVLVAFTAAALAVSATVHLAAGHVLLDAPRLSVIRTVVNCVLALALVFLGLRLKHPELRWIAYAAVIFGTLKLLFEDLRLGNASSLVLSLLFYGLILILVPRLNRRAARNQ